MENLTPNSALTFESLMASIHESNRFLTEKFSETERLQKETDRLLKEQIAENKRREKQADERQKQADERQKRLDERQKKEDERQKKEERQRERYEKRMKNLEKLTGSWSNNHGTFAEEYFYNAFLDGQQNFFGEKFKSIRNQVHSVTEKLEDEYDIVLYNHSSVAIIEAEYKAHVNDVPKALKKVDTFRALFPDYKDFKIYLGLASMSFYPKLEQLCTEQGIAIIKQVGNSVIINDAHLKAF
jgi:Skp family chaperone for outer membrane proteins